MLLHTQSAIVFVVNTSETLVVVAQDQLVRVIQFDVALSEKHILFAADLIRMQFWCQDRQSGGRGSGQVWHIENLWHVGTLTVISKKEEGFVLLDWATETPAELVDSQSRALVRLSRS